MHTYTPTSNEYIQGYLAEKRPLIHACVSNSGQIFYAETADRLAGTALQALQKIVAFELKLATPPPTQQLSPDDIAKMQTPAVLEINRRGAHSPRQSTEIADGIIREGVAVNASDVFIDIREKLATVSYKVHGRVIKDEQTLISQTARKVVRALWTKGNTDWDESGPCDVAFTVDTGAGCVTRVRGNSLREDTRGHTVALRLRNPKEVIALEKAGYLPDQLAALRRMSEATGGVLVIAGPTDSGKSTSLTAIVQGMPAELRKIELADPTEIFLDHCTHVSIERNVDGSYRDLGRILGAMVRQNPDVLILGEIRDKLSASAAMSMAQQGKRVYTSLHANGCAGVPPRLADLGIDLGLLGFREFFIGCVSQNLVACLCPECSTPMELHPGADKEHINLFGDQARVTGSGCEGCRNGVIGQTVVAEVYPLIDDPGPAYQLIKEGNFSALATYMSREHKVLDKHDAAARLVIAGHADAFDIIQRLGRFPRRDYLQAVP